VSLLSARNRIQQGVRALVSGLHPVEDALAQPYLSPDLFALYRQMRRFERQHSLRVLRALLASGHSQADLLTAALLHDVGKTRFSFSVPEKVLVVLVKAILPGTYWRWGRLWQPGSRAFWQRPFAISVQHPAWGAAIAAQAGASPLACALIRDHAEITPTRRADRRRRSCKLKMIVVDAYHRAEERPHTN
jgi:hypothetical protein